MSGREVVILILVAAGVVLVGVLFLGLLWGLGGTWGFSGHMGVPGMMGGIPFWGLLLFCLAPLLLGIVVIGGLAWLISSRDSGARPPQGTCPNCGEPVQEAWNNCPNCGQSLRSV